MDFNTAQGLFGNPYVGWSPRPAKNGQPPPCYGQCNLNIGARKVGAAMKRLPQLYYGPKVKEQILQKWDPVSRSLVNIHKITPPVPKTNIIITYAAFNYSLSGTSTVSYDISTDLADTVTINIYDNGPVNNTIQGTPFATPTVLTMSAQSNLSDFIEIPSDSLVEGNFYYLNVSPTNGPSVQSSLFEVPIRTVLQVSSDL
jgi:hypothetical protein